MTVMEVAIYALVLANPSPALCRLAGATVTCSNGLVANVVSDDRARFSNGVTVQRAGDQAPSFSNGITSTLTRDGRLVFSNGVRVRKISVSRFDFDNGVSCRAELPDLVYCAVDP